MAKETQKFDFDLTGPDGNQISPKDFNGKMLAVYVGFAGCANACPISLHQFGRAIEEMGEEAQQVQPIFISIDPADTPEKLKEYAEGYSEIYKEANPDSQPLVALQADGEALREIKKGLSFVDGPKDSTGQIDHSSLYYFFDGNGDMVGYFNSVTGHNETIEPPSSSKKDWVDSIKDFLTPKQEARSYKLEEYMQNLLDKNADTLTPITPEKSSAIEAAPATAKLAELDLSGVDRKDYATSSATPDEVTAQPLAAVAQAVDAIEKPAFKRSA